MDEEPEWKGRTAHTALVHFILGVFTAFQNHRKIFFLLHMRKLSSNTCSLCMNFMKRFIYDVAQLQGHEERLKSRIEDGKESLMKFLKFELIRSVVFLCEFVSVPS